MSRLQVKYFPKKIQRYSELSDAITRLRKNHLEDLSIIVHSKTLYLIT